jgi:alginate O-acetyltransferase complex protein AlgI
MFLPVVLTGYVLIPTIRLRNLFLLAASLFFYAWGEGLYLLIMLFSIGANYLVGLLVAGSTQQRSRLFWLSAGIAINLALLGFFKYANFLVDSLNAILAPINIAPVALAPVHLPIGISFFTFQAISYIVDVYRGHAKPRSNPLECGLYIALFPQLIAGPIVRYEHIARQITSRRHTVERLADGIVLFICGLGKKMLLANPMGEVADQIFAVPAGELPALVAWSGALAYGLQIYFDFSGYSDMAIGLGKMFGFELRINFNYPYISSSFREFWRRWHISLSTWFRDYLYIPLGGNRRGRWRTGLNLLLVFFLCGLWHGASWTFIIWGLLHGVFLVLERGRFGRLLETVWRPLRHTYFLVFLLITWVFFRAETLAMALAYLSAMFSFGSLFSIAHPVGLYWSPAHLLVAVIGIVASTPLVSLGFRRLVLVAENNPAWQGIVYLCRMCGSAALFILCAMALAAGAYNPFIYFRF